MNITQRYAWLAMSLTQSLFIIFVCSYDYALFVFIVCIVSDQYFLQVENNKKTCYKREHNPIIYKFCTI